MITDDYKSAMQQCEKLNKEKMEFKMGGNCYYERKNTDVHSQIIIND